MTHDIAKKKTITSYIDGWVIIESICAQALLRVNCSENIVVVTTI